MTPCIRLRSCRCAPAWGRAGCCTWGIVRWPPWRRARFSTRGRIFICARCRRSRCLRTCWTPTWHPSGRGSRMLPPSITTGRQATQNRLPRATYELREPLTAVVAGETCTWTERRLVIRSLAQARAGEAALHTRLAQAQTALADLQTRRQGKPRCTELPAVREAAEAILARYRVQGLLRLHYEEHVCERPVRRYGVRPATVRVEREVRVTAVVDQDAVTAAVQRLGWRVYATNQPADHLTLTQAVLAYRSAYLIERGFGRLKGQPLSLTPMYLEREDHVTGLIRLLSVGLRVLTLLEFVVRCRLAAEGDVS